MSLMDLLQKVDLFKGLSFPEVNKIGALCKETSYKEGDIIIEEDQPGEALYVIKSGKARVVKVEGGKEKHVADVAAGELVGEMSIMDNMTTSARVIAEAPTECLVLKREDLDLLLKSDDKLHIKILRALIRTMTLRLRRANQDLILWKMDFNE
jgi:CRP/FNR family cyclic AMP-dependent transcriptional regulator